MNEPEKNIVRRVLAKVREAKRLAAMYRRREKDDYERDHAELTLILDDLKSVCGLEPGSAEALAAAELIFRSRRAGRSERQPYCDVEGFPTGNDL